MNPSSGRTVEAFHRVREEFDSYLESDPTFSAQLAVRWQGRSVVDLAGGPHLDGTSITGVFSSTKGIAAAVIGLLIDRGQLELDARVAVYWPEFASRDKGAITVRQLLSHRAGIVGVDGGFRPDELADSAVAAARLAAAPPVWQPGSAHGYHALTIGVLMEELVRRVAGTTLQHLYETEIRAPRRIDFYLGLPASEESRFVPVLPPVSAAPGEAVATDTMQSLAFNTLHSTFAPHADASGPNNRSMRVAGTAAINGIGSARGLADVYGAILGTAGSAPIVSEPTVEAMSRQQSFGLDRVLGFTTSFGIVYMKPHPQLEFGSYRAFGHDGAGGALAFADPLYDLAFGYVPMPMQPPGGADQRAIQLSRIVRHCIRTR